MSNRVEDLERQVAELQAAVNGLTEELVEMKERVRQVEDAQEVSVEADAQDVSVEADAQDGATDAPAATTDDDDAEASDTPSDAAGGERRTHSDDHVEVVEQTGTAAETADESAPDTTADAGDDMVVPEREATTPDAEAASSGSEGSETEDDESDDSDIIVA